MRGRVALQNGSELVQARTVDGAQQGTVRDDKDRIRTRGGAWSLLRYHEGLPDGHKDINGSLRPARKATAAATTATANRYRVPVAVIPSGKISFQAVRNRFISSSVPIETRK